MFALVMLFALLLGPLSPAEQAAVDTAKSVAVQIRATISSTLEAAPEEAICSGTIVGFDSFTNDLVVLTARHCTEGDDFETITDTSVATESGELFKVDKVYRSNAADLAFIEVKSIPFYGRKHSKAAFATDEVQQGEGVFFYGMPAGTPWALQFARGAQGPMFNSTPSAPDEMQGLFSLDCPMCGPGDSGAGVFDQNGGLKGVLTDGRGQPEMILYVPLFVVKTAYYTFLHTR